MEDFALESNVTLLLSLVVASGVFFTDLIPPVNCMG